MDQDDFEIRIGRIRDADPARRGMRPALDRASPAAFGGGRPRPQGGRGALGRGRAAALAAARLSPARRVVVKVKVARCGVRGRRLLRAHLEYLRREGVGRDGGEGRLFDRAGAAEDRAFASRCAEDRRHFRIVVSPRDACELPDLRATTRDLMAQAERDLSTRLDWVAAEHWNTAHPHVHVVVRGRADTGRDLVVSGDYLAAGLRSRAEALVTLELGPPSLRELARDLRRDVGTERWTRLDDLLSRSATGGWLALDPVSQSSEPGLRPLFVARLEVLERLGLATREADDAWRLSDGHEARLRGRAPSLNPGLDSGRGLRRTPGLADTGGGERHGRDGLRGSPAAPERSLDPSVASELELAPGSPLTPWDDFGRRRPGPRRGLGR